MERQIQKPNGGEIKGTDPSRASEREFTQALDYMIEQMSRQIRNQVLLELNKGTVEKFADSAVCTTIDFLVPVIEPIEQPYTYRWYTDAQGSSYDYYDVGGYTDGLTLHEEARTRTSYQRTGVKWVDCSTDQVLKLHNIQDAQIGNYATVFLKLNRAAQRKVLKRFDDKRLERVARDILNKVNRRNADQFYSRVERQVGINASELLNSEGLQANINALILESAQWAKKLRDDTLEFYTSNTLRAMAEGKSLSEVLEQFDGMVEKRKNHAKTVARTQVSTFNSLVGKARAQNLGIEKAVWVTSRDERVRPCHQVRNGKEFDLSKGLYSSCDGKFLLPGVDYNCRCTYEYVIPEE